MADYEENIVNHTVKSGNKNMAETGKQFGSIVGLVPQKLETLYEEIKIFENKLSNFCLAKMIVMNDLKRIPFLKNNNIKEAYDIAKQNYKTKGKKTLNKLKCDAKLCLLF